MKSFSICENQTRISLLIIKSLDTSNGKIGHFLASLFADSVPFPYDIPCSNTQVNITNNNVDKYISICNINIRNVRNILHFLQNFAEEYDILYVTESHLDVNINNDDLSLDFVSKPSPARIVITQAVDFSFILKMIYLVNM